MDDLSAWFLVGLGVIALIQGWATFGPWVSRKLDPAIFDLTFGEGTTTISRRLQSIGTVTLRVKSLARRPIKAEQFFLMFSEQLTLQGYSYAGIPMQLLAPPPAIGLGDGARVRVVGGPSPIYFSNNDTVLFDLVFSTQAPGDYQVRVRIWPEGESFVELKPMTVNVAA
jgi:hypothetical protein